MTSSLEVGGRGFRLGTRPPIARNAYPSTRRIAKSDRLCFCLLACWLAPHHGVSRNEKNTRSSFQRKPGCISWYSE